jgi:hypothetical protein
VDARHGRLLQYRFDGGISPGDLVIHLAPSDDRSRSVFDTQGRHAFEEACGASRTDSLGGVQQALLPMLF